MAKDKPAGEASGAVVAAPAVENGVRIKAPVGVDTISVGGVSFAADAERFFVVPEALARAAVAHLKSFEDAARREWDRVEAAAARKLAEEDLPGRIKALEQRLAELEATLGIGVNRG